ncbi:AI-2E family transporter [Candidatus Nanohalobium constans]|uniref:AI-2E family transporter n=1 Tax=Candidatus Nanohalobium constans TaxID=2565781 RepID=A0A5Q0UIF3_9ARCH|nr:AI-2E family transporter [Candidatus Nanohalobium constans]QGA80725.1 AI-2E family transporter [Candidatus Nanohalobium constans]
MDEGLRAKRETLLVVSILILGSMLIVFPFLDAILIGAAVSYILSQVHDKLNPHIQNEFLSSTIIIFSVFAFVAIGLYFFINNFFEILAQLNLFTGSLEDKIISALEPLDLPETFIENIRQYINNFSQSISSILIDLFASLPAIIIDLGIFLVTSTYLYKDRRRISRELDRLLKSLPPTEKRIIQNLVNSTENIFKGVFLTQAIVAVILGAIMGLGLWLISALTTPIPLIPLWAILVGVASLLPLVANFMIYVPLGGYFMTSAGEPIKGMLVITFGLIFLQIMPEIFLRPYIGSKRLDEHPLIVFLGFLAGPLVLGFKGLILGPVVLILTKEFALSFSDMISDVESDVHSEDTEE